jgi:uncharacterized protein
MYTTWLAFQDWRYPALRALGGFAVAALTGLILRRVPLEFAFRPQFLGGLSPAGPAASLSPAGRGAEAPHSGSAPVQTIRIRRLSYDAVMGAGTAVAAAAPRRPAWRALGASVGGVLSHVRADFLEMSVYFMFGVFIAAAMKTFIPTGAFAQLADGTFSGPLAMMLTAFTLSLCSEADAFPAARFTEFNLNAKLAFLVFGPMLDIKLLMMYRSMFRSRFVAAFAAVVSLLVLVYALLLGGLR